MAATTVRTAAQGKLRGSPERARVVQRAQSAVSRPATSSSERTKLATRRSAAAASDTRKLAATEHPPPTQWTPSESEALAVLALEDAADDPREANRKLERRLRDKGLKPLGREHVERLRAFKNAVQADLGSGPKSRHFTEPHGLYANPEDFDYSKLVRDYTAAFPSISAAAVAAFIPVGVYYYYLR